jgi:putative holliday junction resolvase
MAVRGRRIIASPRGGLPAPAAAKYDGEVRVLGVDLGRKRVGLAVSDASGTLARPLRTLALTGSRKDALEQVVAEIRTLAAEDEGLALVVIGRPTHLDGTPSEETAHVEAFARALQGRTRMKIAYENERLSSREAESRLALRERDWRKRKERLDAAAAAVILQDFLDRHPARTASQEGVGEDVRGTGEDGGDE